MKDLPIVRPNKNTINNYCCIMCGKWLGFEDDDEHTTSPMAQIAHPWAEGGF